jgi:hypothetical protein
LVENFILLALKLIMTKDRNNIIEISQLKNNIRNMFILEKNGFKKKYNKFKARWAKVEEQLFRDNI